MFKSESEYVAGQLTFCDKTTYLFIWIAMGWILAGYWRYLSYRREQNLISITADDFSADKTRLAEVKKKVFVSALNKFSALLYLSMSYVMLSCSLQSHQKSCSPAWERKPHMPQGKYQFRWRCLMIDDDDDGINYFHFDDI